MGSPPSVLPFYIPLNPWLVPPVCDTTLACSPHSPLILPFYRFFLRFCFCFCFCFRFRSCCCFCLVIFSFHFSGLLAPLRSTPTATGARPVVLAHILRFGSIVDVAVNLEGTQALRWWDQAVLQSRTLDQAPLHPLEILHISRVQSTPWRHHSRGRCCSSRPLSRHHKQLSRPGGMASAHRLCSRTRRQELSGIANAMLGVHHSIPTPTTVCSSSAINQRTTHR